MHERVAKPFHDAIRLGDHTASWEHTNVAVRMDIERSGTALLLPSRSSLSSLNYGIGRTSRKASNPRLGAICIDVALYAEKEEIVGRVCNLRQRVKDEPFAMQSINALVPCDQGV